MHGLILTKGEYICEVYRHDGTWLAEGFQSASGGATSNTMMLRAGAEGREAHKEGG